LTKAITKALLGTEYLAAYKVFTMTKHNATNI